VNIVSEYSQAGKTYRREFSFSSALGGVGSHTLAEAPITKNQTMIHLKGFKADYIKTCPSKPDTVAWKIVEHCLSVFLTTPAPAISIEDEGRTISLNAICSERVFPFASDSQLLIDSESFNLVHLRLYGADTGQQHSIHLCANGRDVEQIALTGRIPGLIKKLDDDSGRSFYYQCYVTSRFLDDLVDRQRTSFRFSKSDEMFSISLERLTGELVAEAKAHLAEYLAIVREAVRQKAELLIGKRHPEFRRLLNQFSLHLDEFSPDVADETILRKFNDIHLEQEAETHKEAAVLIEKAEKGEYGQAYDVLFTRYLDNLANSSSVNLSRYVLHRKTILELLRTMMESSPQGKYTREEAIHHMMFPVRSTSDEIEFHRWNLWILDEKLAFHFYLASDRPLSDVAGGPHSGKEPDLLIIDNPAAFADSEMSPLNSVVIVELKKPERSDYALEGETKNPIDQVLSYVKTIQDNKELSVRGRRIMVTDGTPFYCYIIADLTPRLRDIAKIRGFTNSPDALGCFWYNPGFRSYIEIISFEKLIQDAQQRNLALFKMLNLNT